MYTVSSGLNGKPGSISFESVIRPGYYVVHKNGYIDVDSLPNTGMFIKSLKKHLKKVNQT